MNIYHSSMGAFNTKPHRIIILHPELIRVIVDGLDLLAFRDTCHYWRETLGQVHISAKWIRDTDWTGRSAQLAWAKSLTTNRPEIFPLISNNMYNTIPQWPGTIHHMIMLFRAKEVTRIVPMVYVISDMVDAIKNAVASNDIPMMEAYLPDRWIAISDDTSTTPPWDIDNIAMDINTSLRIYMETNYMRHGCGDTVCNKHHAHTLGCIRLEDMSRFIHSTVYNKVIAERYDDLIEICCIFEWSAAICFCTVYKLLDELSRHYKTINIILSRQSLKLPRDTLAKMKDYICSIGYGRLQTPIVEHICNYYGSM